MTNVLLHAGLPKTGTTTIQNWLVENALHLRAEGIFTQSRSQLTHRMAVEGVTSQERRAQADFPAIMAWRLEEARAELAQAARDPVISRIVLSSEYFSIAEPRLVKQLLEDMDLNQVTVIFVLRRQDRLIESGFNQDVKSMGAALPIGEPVYHEGYNWDVLASSWENEFGQENIALRLYDEFDPANGGIVYQVFGPLDLSLAQLAREYVPALERSNPSLPASLIEFKRLANSVGAYDVLPLLERASQIGVGGPPFRMKREIAKGFLDIYRESNRKVAKHFFQREGDLFDESDLEGEPAGADYTGRLPVETLAMLFALHLQEQAEDARNLKHSVEQLEANIEASLNKLREPQ